MPLLIVWEEGHASKFVLGTVVDSHLMKRGKQGGKSTLGQSSQKGLECEKYLQETLTKYENWLE